MTGEKMASMHELTFNELVEESQYLLKSQSDKIKKKYREVTQ